MYLLLASRNLLAMVLQIARLEGNAYSKKIVCF